MVVGINFNVVVDGEVEGETVVNLLAEIGGNAPLIGINDLFIWWKNSSGFSVKAAYSMVLEGILKGPNLDDNLLQSLTGMWKTKIPSKVLIFGWTLLLNRIPTKVNL